MIGTTTSWYWPKVLGVPVTPESRKLPNEKNRRFRHFCHFLEFFLICAYRVTSDNYSCTPGIKSTRDRDFSYALCSINGTITLYQEYYEYSSTRAGTGCYTSTSFGMCDVGLTVRGSDPATGSLQWESLIMPSLARPCEIM